MTVSSRNLYFTMAVCILVALAGCSNAEQESFVLPKDFLELAPRAADKFPDGKICRFTELQSNDVLIAVNGLPLTRQALDEMMLLRTLSLMSKKGASPEAVGKEIDEFRSRYLDAFLGQRLLVDEAFRLKLVTEEEVRREVTESVRKAAAAVKRPIATYLKTFKGMERYYFYELAVSYVMNKIIKAKIPPKLVVTPDFVSNVQAQVRADNIAAVETNRLNKALLAQVRTRILAGELDFATAANRYSHVEKDDVEAKLQKDGAWGEFREESLNERIGPAVFALKAGAVSDVLEDDNGLRLVKVLAVKPAQKDADGAIIASETRTLAQVYISKVMQFVEDSEIVLTRDLKNQMQVQAINEFTTDLATNGVNRIEYPHGKNLFK